MSDTPRTDAFIAEFERELGDGPPNISEAAIDVGVRLRLLEWAKGLERGLAACLAEGAATDTAFAAMQRELAEARASRDDAWIAVGDRLPLEHQSVLVYGSKRLEWAVANWTDANKWEIESCSDFYSIYPPTHWMPLPAPPLAASKEGKE